MRFPTGWAGDISEGLQDAGIDVEIEDKRRNIEFLVDFPRAENIHPPRDYQQWALHAANTTQRGIIHNPCRSGKTVVAAHLINNYCVKTLVLVPSQDLLDQTSSVFKQYWPYHVGMIGDGIWAPNDITVAIPNSLWINRTKPKVKDLLSGIHMIIADEAHRVNRTTKGEANMWFKLTQMCDAKLRFALTGSLTKEDLADFLLRGAFGRVIHEASVKELRDKGFLVDADVTMHKIKTPNFGEESAAYESGICTNAERNRLIVKIAKQKAKEGKRTIVFVERIDKHGRPLNEAMLEAGIKVEFLNGRSGRGRRGAVKDAFIDGEVQVVLTTVWGEGVDVPACDVVIMAGAHKSFKSTVQKSSRPLTIAPGKNKGEIYDFMDDDGGVLLKHSKERKRIYEKVGEFKVNIVDGSKA